MKNTKKNKIIGFLSILVIGFAFVGVAFAGAPILSINPNPSVSTDSATFSVFYDVNGDVLTSVAVRYGTDTAMKINTSSVIPTTNSGNLTFTANNLSSNTTYYFQAIGISSSGTVLSSRYSFTTKSIKTPILQTYANPSNITDRSAVVYGFYDSNDSNISNMYFEYGASSSLGQSQSVSFSGKSGTVSSTLSNLNSNTKYYYRLVAVGNGVTIRGSVYTLTTLNSNNNNNNNNNNGNNYPSCYYDGTCYFDGYKWVNYDDDDRYYDEDKKDKCVFGNNCKPTCYYFGNCKNNNNENNIYLNISTSNAVNINSNSATLSGNVYTNNSNSNAYFEYGTTPNLGRSTQKLYSNNQNTNYVYTVRGLSSNTTYYFRIVGESNGVKEVGNIISFKTSGSNSNVVLGNTNNTNTTSTTNSSWGSGGSSLLDRIKNSSSNSSSKNTSNVSNNSYNQDGTFLASGAGFSGSFFPNTVLGWLVVVLFILLLVMIAKRVFSNYKVVKNA